MKKSLKLIALALVAVLVLGVFAACSSTDTDEDTTDVAEEVITIGILQYGSHPSLDNCYDGIIEALEASDLNYEIDYQNGNFESATCDTIAKTMVASGCDVIIPIATPAATSAYSACAEQEIPVIFCAVSDPVAAGLVESLEEVGGHSTGTATVINFDTQLDMIMALQPDVETIGVLYTTSESNSVTDLARIEEAAEERGLTIISSGVQAASDIPAAAVALAAQVDCINNFADNNVVNNLSVVIEAATAAGIPVYGSEVEQVENGCLAAEGIDYVEVGRQTAYLAIEVLEGTAVSDLAVVVLDDSTPAINLEVLEYFGLELPEAYEDAELITETTEEE